MHASLDFPVFGPHFLPNDAIKLRVAI